MVIENKVYKKKNNRHQWLISLLGAFIFLFTLPAYSASKTILVLGDSLSAEYGLERGTGWVPLLEKHLKNIKSPYSVINASISGDTTSSGYSRLPQLLKQHQPTVIIIELGSNDALRGLQLSMTKTNLSNIVNLSKTSGAKVLLVGMQIPPNYGKTYADAFKQIYPDIAKNANTALVPFLMDHIAGDLNWFQQDRIHPNEKAQPTLLNNVLPHLMPLLK